MVIKAFSDKVLLKSKRDVIRLHLYFKLLQYGIRPLENDLKLMIELYMFGGYYNAEQQRDFIKLCLDKKLKKSDQSVRNTISKYINLKVFVKPNNSVAYMNTDFIPKVTCDKLILQHTVSHAE